MKEPIVDFSPDTITQISNLFTENLPRRDKFEFQSRSQDYIAKLASAEEVRSSIAATQESAAEILTEAKHTATLAHNELQQAQDKIALKPETLYTAGNSRIVWGHIQVALYKRRDRLPFYLKPLERFAKPIHPYLISYSSQVNQAEKDFKAAEDLYKEQTVNPNKENQLQAQLDAAATSRNRLASFCDNKAATNEELVRKYIAIVPERAHPAAEVFATQHLYSPAQLSRFDEFVNDLAKFVTPDRYQAFRHSIRNLPNNVTESDIKGLPQATQKAWKAWIAYKLESDLAREKITEQPLIPPALLLRN